METYNLGWKYSRDYFSDINLFEEITAGELNEKNQVLYDYTLDEAYSKSFLIPNCSSEFTLKTVYPGLLIGTGLAHATGKSDEEYKIGFFFDHTSGLPCIPGSSVKGAIRSIFTNILNNPEINEGDRIECFQYLAQMPELAVNTEQLQQLELAIFQGRETDSFKIRDIFYDAFPIRCSENGFLDKDYITTHREGIYKDPTPLQMLKITGGVEFKFQFKLHDTIVDENFTFKASDKKKLFCKILEEYGIGAKTNVGYGQFAAIVPPKTYSIGDQEEVIISNVVTATGEIYYKLPDSKQEKRIPVGKQKVWDFSKGQAIILTVKSLSEDGKIKNMGF